jgi:hypothetical protein
LFEKRSRRIVDVLRVSKRTRQTLADNKPNRIGVCDDPLADEGGKEISDGEIGLASGVQVDGTGKSGMANNRASRKTEGGQTTDLTLKTRTTKTGVRKIISTTFDTNSFS